MEDSTHHAFQKQHRTSNNCLLAARLASTTCFITSAKTKISTVWSKALFYFSPVTPLLISYTAGTTNMHIRIKLAKAQMVSQYHVVHVFPYLTGPTCNKRKKKRGYYFDKWNYHYSQVKQCLPESQILKLASSFQNCSTQQSPEGLINEALFMPDIWLVSTVESTIFEKWHNYCSIQPQASFHKYESILYTTFTVLKRNSHPSL